MDIKRRFSKCFSCKSGCSIRIRWKLFKSNIVKIYIWGNHVQFVPNLNNLSSTRLLKNYVIDDCYNNITPSKILSNILKLDVHIYLKSYLLNGIALDKISSYKSKIRLSSLPHYNPLNSSILISHENIKSINFIELKVNGKEIKDYKEISSDFIIAFVHTKNLKKGIESNIKNIIGIDLFYLFAN